jgi:hypothetical protein
MRNAGVVCQAALLSILLAGCGTKGQPKSAFEPIPKETTVMTNAIGAKSEVVSLYQAMQELLGGDWNDNTRDWGPCDMPDGKEGVSYALVSKRAEQPLPAAPRKVAEQAQAIWAHFGHPIEIEYDDVMTPPLYILSDPSWLSGTKPNGLLVQFTVAENFAGFTATSRCVLGDEEELNLPEE